MNHSTQNVGNAGEYYIASRLSAENFITTITLGRAMKYDILTVNPSGKTYKISIKTRLHDGENSFLLSEKDEEDPADDLYYIFVRLNNFETEPDFWVVPSKRVSEIIGAYHKEFITRGNMDNTRRSFSVSLPPSYEKAFPADWNTEIKSYYKNIQQLK